MPICLIGFCAGVSVLVLPAAYPVLRWEAGVCWLVAALLIALVARIRGLKSSTPLFLGALLMRHALTGKNQC